MIFQFGLSHDVAPVALRERVAFSAGQVTEALAGLSVSGELQEVAILSTCNRTEFYAVAESAESAREAIARFLVRDRGLETADVAGFAMLSGLDAAEHLLRVAAGLASAILGEGQILGQVRDAAAVARNAGTLGPVLDSLFRHAIGAGKRVRTETTISQGAVSVGAAAVDLARQRVGELGGRVVLLLGAGKIGEVTLKHLAAQGVRKILVSNRTLDSAHELARTCNGEAVPFHALAGALAEADVVLCCTGAPHFILSEADLAPIAAGRRSLQVIVDVSVPRNIDPAIKSLTSVELFDIDDVAAIADHNRAEREAQAPHAEQIVTEEVERYEGWLRSYQAAPTIASLRHKVEALRQGELERFLSRHGADLTDEQREAIDKLTQAIANKFLHAPTVGLKAQTGAKRDAHVSAIRELFGLKDARRANG